MQNFNILRNQTYQFDKIGAIDNGSLVTFINNYLFAIIEQLNTFIGFVETKLLTLNRQINTCYSNLHILEMKLNSINIPSEITKIDTTNGPIIENEQGKSNSSPIAENTDTTDVGSSPSEEQCQVSTTDDLDQEVITSKGVDLSYLDKYRKMLKFGVHENAVKQKMTQDGLDPSLLNI